MMRLYKTVNWPFQNRSKKKNRSILQYAIICSLLLLLQLSNASAESANPDSVLTNDQAANAAADKTADRAPAASRNQDADEDSDDEYNFSWLDPDKQVYVLQNRKYRKSRKLAAYFSGGINLSNAYKSEFLGTPRLGYWFTEQMGVEVFYSFVSNSDSDNFSSLKKVSASALPFVRETKSYVGGVFTWAPWYAKLNFFNKILYFDWALNAGLGQASTSYDENNTVAGAPRIKEENFTAFFAGTSQNFFLSRDWSVRLDLIGMFYSAKGSDGVTTKTFKNIDFTVGVGYLF